MQFVTTNKHARIILSIKKILKIVYLKKGQVKEDFLIRY